MRIYLDNSFLNRPFDDSLVGMNRLEAEILLKVVELIQQRKVRLVNSSMVEYENSRNPFPERGIFIENIVKLAPHYQNLNPKIHRRALVIQKDLHVDPLDSLHIASAEAARVDFIITCDYSSIRKYKGHIQLVTPLNFIQYYENNSS
jgi:predicted nucleic acid-binding protein